MPLPALTRAVPRWRRRPLPSRRAGVVGPRPLRPRRGSGDVARGPFPL